MMCNLSDKEATIYVTFPNGLFKAIYFVPIRLLALYLLIGKHPMEAFHTTVYGRIVWIENSTPRPSRLDDTLTSNGITYIP